MGARSRLRLYGRSGVVRPRPGGISGRQGQGRRDQRRHNGQVEQGPAARQLAIRQDKQQEESKRDLIREARVEQMELRDGTTLNNLLAQILDIDPTVSKSSRTDAPISASAIKEIPFEWDSEAVSVCLDQMTGKDSLPAPLMAPLYADAQCPARGSRAGTRRGRQGERLAGSPQANRPSHCQLPHQIQEKRRRFRAGLRQRTWLLHHAGQPDAAFKRPQHEDIPGEAR